MVLHLHNWIYMSSTINTIQYILRIENPCCLIIHIAATAISLLTLLVLPYLKSKKINKEECVH